MKQYSETHTTHTVNTNETAVGRTLAERLDDIAAKLDQMAALITASRHSVSATSRPPLLLVGWTEIARVFRKSPRTLRRYVQREGLPIFRWGRHVVSTPTLLDNWLLAREVAKGEQPRKRSADLYRGPNRRYKGMGGLQGRREAKALVEHMVAG